MCYGTCFIFAGLSIQRPNLLLGIIVKQKKVIPSAKDSRFIKQQLQQNKLVDQHGKSIEKRLHPGEAQKQKAMDPRRRYHPATPMRYRHLRSIHTDRLRK